MSCGRGEVVAMNKPMWLYPKIMGFNPPEKWGHTSCYSNGFLYVYGGCCGGLHFRDVLVLNLETMAWNKLMTTGQDPGPRDSHSAVLVEQKMIIFGGTNGTKKVNDVHVLDLKSREWSRPHCEGIAPSPRESHTATLFGNKELVIFGGSGEGGANYLNDLHILDLKTMSWTSPQVHGDIPVPRDSHSAVAIENKLIVYGGDCGVRYQGDVDMLDMETTTWSKLVVHGPSPGVRAGHVAVCYHSRVYVIGGVGDKKYYNDVWFLDTSTCVWTRLEICGQKPQGRFSHTALAMDTNIAIYGGCGEDDQPMNELLILQLGAEHLKGRYNSIGKHFGSQGNRGFTKEAHVISKTTIMNGNVNMVTYEDKEIARELSFQLSSDTLHPKRRRTSNPVIYDIESEPEENSLSLSQHSSPSYSDRDQTPANKVTWLAKTPQLFPVVKQHCPVSHNSQPSEMHCNQFDPRNIIDRAPQDLYFSRENLNQRKPEDFHHGRNIIHDIQILATDQIPSLAGQLEIPIGTGVYGKVDGVFDSGYLMTATVNGREFRGVLFSPGPEVFSSGVRLGKNNWSPTRMQQNPYSSCIKPNFLNHSQQLQASEINQNFQQVYGTSKRNSFVESTSLLGRDLKARSELQGVVLTLGGPGSSGGF
ncbi:Galactose oxidase/kelch repeat superfamily protein [Heracleum sosnowskyi]|uniref:Galactose oxidase/kelch repeat superfamily protein n=1 Tax=Heracleum sosnowskyi TaxID=360622 RepID=A0AAD8JD04_9APIA|nr:Galactose oxidase/kelch repeat superfamily protein [Heracleum sosnowskyi]